MFLSTKQFYLIFIIFCFLFTQVEPAEYKVTDQVFFDIQHKGQYFGRIVIGLFGEAVPKTVKNFKHIASKGINGKSYRGTKIHRIIKRFMIQGGDIVHNNGSGSLSIYGKYFDDENFIIKHNGVGMVSMANTGPNTNGCQFFITTMPTPWLDGHHTIFGRVVKGQDIVHKIEHLRSDGDDKPWDDVIIIKSGIIKGHSPFYENDDPYELTLWAWIKAGWFPLSFSFAILGFFHYIMSRLNSLKTFD